MKGGKRMSKQISIKDRLAKMGGEKEEPQKQAITNGRADLENFNTRLIPELHIEMKVYCAKNRMKIQDFINEAIKDRLTK